jgi:regulator of sirC expression with transglutaminase-like and TPR domain
MTRSTQIRIFAGIILASASVLAATNVQPAEILSARRETTILANKPARDAVGTIRAILALPDDKIDFGRAALTFDRLADPSTDIEATLRQIDRMVQVIRAMAGPAPSNRTKLIALKTYIYRSGVWNDYKPYQYDFSDPYGRDFSHALIARYIETRRGNCVSMPFLFIILADRLGLPVTASMAPRHVFVKYADDVTGKTVNLETTSGANPARDVWLRHVIPMSDLAVENGVYLKPLTRRETVAVMAGVVVESDFAKKKYDGTIKVADVLLQYYPHFVQAMAFQGAAASRLVDAEFRAEYQGPDDIPIDQRLRYWTLAEESRSAYAKAEALGWRATDGNVPATPPKAQ